MRICPRCQKHRKELQTVVKDKKTKKHWLITYCDACHYNFDLEESKGGTTAKEEIEKPSEMPWTKGWTI